MKNYSYRSNGVDLSSLINYLEDEIYDISNSDKLEIPEEVFNFKLLDSLSLEEKKYIIVLSFALSSSSLLNPYFQEIKKFSDGMDFLKKEKIGKENHIYDLSIIINDISSDGNIEEIENEETEDKESFEYLSDFYSFCGTDKLSNKNISDFISFLICKKDIDFESKYSLKPENSLIRFIINNTSNRKINILSIPIITSLEFRSSIIEYINTLSSDFIISVLMGMSTPKLFFSDCLTDKINDFFHKEDIDKKRHGILSEYYSKINSSEEKINKFRKIHKLVNSKEISSIKNGINIINEEVGDISKFSEKHNTAYLRVYLPFELSIPNNDHINSIAMLESKFPNFKNVIDYILIVLKSQLKSNIPLSLGNIIICGSKECGKTLFLKEISTILGAFYKNISGIDSYGALYGTSSYWSTATPGYLLEKICLSKKANNIFIFDCIDEVLTNHNENNSNLSSILSKEESSLFSSSFYDCNINLSMNSYFMASRSVGSISSSLLNESIVFEIRSLSYSEKSNILKNEYDSIMNEYKIPFEEIEPLTDEHINNLLENNLKRAKNILKNGILKAYTSDIHDVDKKSKILIF